jgi:enoyl-CoA hydratase/carnithine racemase
MYMTLKHTRVRRSGRVTIVTIARPDVYNALHSEAHYELADVFDDFARDRDQLVAIITGEGDKAFCAGSDLKWQAAGIGMNRHTSCAAIIPQGRE